MPSFAQRPQAGAGAVEHVLGVGARRGRLGDRGAGPLQRVHRHRHAQVGQHHQQVEEQAEGDQGHPGQAGVGPGHREQGGQGGQQQHRADDQGQAKSPQRQQHHQGLDGQAGQGQADRLDPGLPQPPQGPAPGQADGDAGPGHDQEQQRLTHGENYSTMPCLRATATARVRSETPSLVKIRSR